MRTARVRVPWNVRALSVALLMLLPLGALIPAVVTAQGATGAHATVTEDAPWHYDPGLESGFSVPAGDDVVILDGPQDGTYFVAWGDDRGWIDGDFLDIATEGDVPVGDSDTSSSSSSDDAASDTESESESGDTSATSDGSDSGDAFSVDVPSADALGGLQARIANSDDGVNLRSDPSVDAEVVAKLSVDTIVALRIDDVDTVMDEDGETRWWPVRSDGQDGWVAGSFLSSVDGSAEDGDVSDAEQAGDDATAERDAPRFASGDYVAAETSSGSGVNIRSDPAPDADRIGFIPEGSVVQVEDGPAYDDSGNGWYQVSDGDVTGYADGDLLTAADAPAPETASADRADNAPAAKFSPGEQAAAQTDDRTGVNIRDNPTVSGALIETIGDGNEVEILSGPYADEAGNGWYQVVVGDVTGYAIGDLLVPPGEALPAASAPGNSSDPSGSFIYPVGGTLTQGFGCTGYDFEPFDASVGCNFHNGIDLAANAYTPIGAADGGTVTAAGWCDCGLGYYVTVDHGNGFSTTYGHMVDQPPVGAGQSVGQGETIGYIGSTGASTGPHVHFIVILNGSDVDPLAYLG